MTTLRQAALDYAQRGWAVFPLQERSKEPAVAGAYKAATSNMATVLAWWDRWPDANIGLATGRVSGVWVIDLDGDEGRASWEQLAEEHPEVVDETLVAATGKGYHLYWRLPTETPDPGRRIGVRPGIDIIGGNGYLVAPPSVHPSGRTYEWLNPDARPVEAPQWMLELQRPKPASRTQQPASSTIFASAPRFTGRPQDGAVGDPQSYLRGVARAASRAVAGAAQGTRNHELFKQAVWVCSVAAALRLDDAPGLRDVWQSARMAGLEELEIERTLQSAMEKGRANPAQVR
jgi:hypothetical protein